MLQKNKTLLFVHDSLPAEGISGMIIFLRHFTQLTNWDIHILIPENAYQAEVVKQYPPHFYVHTFPLRLFWWPTFREDIPIMVKLRIFVLQRLFQKYINRIKPDVLITVQYHYYSVALSQNAIKTDVPLLTFLHDRWDLTSNNPYIQGVRKHYAKETLKKSSQILAVTKELVVHYLNQMPTKAEVFFPIPEGYLSQNSNTGHLKNLVYAGTVEQHHLQFFGAILPIIEKENWQLTVITNHTEKLNQLLQAYQNLEVKKAFKTNKEALQCMDSHASVLLVNYGLTATDNPFAFHSFPSKFIEFSHLGKPIIAVAPLNSPFYNFLKEKNWIAFTEQFSEDGFNRILTRFAEELFYQNNLNQVNELSRGIFNRQKIQGRFEEILTSAYNKK